MRRVEVRCCCSPLLLLGTLPFPDNAREWTYPVCKAPRAQKPQALLKAMATGVKPELVTLQLAEFQTIVDNRPVRGWALKADHVPLEKLRRIPGFIEAAPREISPVHIALPLPSFQPKGSS